MLESVRARLTLWYVSLLAAVLVAFSFVVYGLLTRALDARVDDGLRAVLDVARMSLTHDAAEGQDAADAARSTVAELSNRTERLAIFDAEGLLLARGLHENPKDLKIPPSPSLAEDEVRLYDVPEEPGDDDLHRVAVTRARILPAGIVFVIAASQDLDPVQDDLEAMRTVLARAVPIALAAAAVGGWLLARKSLSPVVGMAAQARRMGAADLASRLPVVNPRDELGQLAETFNELLDRIAEAFAQQRRFMADASHELRTPLAAIRAASSVTLDRPSRGEGEYRDALQVVGDQARRISRLVEDMFTLARADSGHYPLRREPLYLEELLVDAGRAAEVLGVARSINVAVDAGEECPFHGDEDLLIRMVQNLLDNALRHSPPGATVRLALDCTPGEYRISVTDQGPGIPEDAQSRLFERFFRADQSRTRDETGSAGGAGLGLSIARWVAEAHGGRLDLVRSGPTGTVFAAIFPRP